MENIHLNEVSEIIHCVVVYPKKTIQFISERTGIPKDVVRHILLYFYEYPFGGIAIYCEGIPRNTDPFTMDCNILDDIAIWSIDTTRMDRIPVENLSHDESYILFGLLNRLGVIDQNKITFKSQCNTQDFCMMTKGINRDTGKLFDFKQYPFIKKALIDRLSITLINVEQGEEKTTILKPLGIVYQSEDDSWYLMGFDIDEQIITYDIEKIDKIYLGCKFNLSKQFDLKNHLRTYFSLEDNSEELVEVIFLDEANVLEKAQRRLHGKGCFQPIEDGGLLFTGKIIGMRGFKDWLLGFGSSIIVKKPDGLRQEIIEALQGIVANYNVMSEEVSASAE